VDGRAFAAGVAFVDVFVVDEDRLEEGERRGGVDGDRVGHNILLKTLEVQLASSVHGAIKPIKKTLNLYITKPPLGLSSTS